MIHNKIQLTEQGDVVLEKGVRQKSGGMPDELVDGHTGTIDHSIGAYVSMPRDKVVDDKNITCAAGLHAAPPEYVRSHYGSDILIEIIVNPADIISVPVDYNRTKVRCCAYRVMGYSPKSRRQEKVIKLSSFIADLDETRESYGKSSTKSVAKAEGPVTENNGGKIINFGGKTAKEIVKLTMKELRTRKKFGGEVPRRAAVIKKATKMLNEKGYTVIDNESDVPASDIQIKKVTKPKTEVKEIIKHKVKDYVDEIPVKDFSKFKDLSARTIVDQTMIDTKCEKFGGLIPRRAKVLIQAKGVYEKAGWKVTNFNKA